MSLKIKHRIESKELPQLFVMEHWWCMVVDLSAENCTWMKTFTGFTNKKEKKTVSVSEI